MLYNQPAEHPQHLLDRQIVALQQESDSAFPGITNRVVESLRNASDLYCAGELSAGAVCLLAMTAHLTNQAKLEGTRAGVILEGLGDLFGTAASLSSEDLTFLHESAEVEVRIARYSWLSR